MTRWSSRSSPQVPLGLLVCVVVVPSPISMLLDALVSGCSLQRVDASAVVVETVWVSA
jgi:hypothetical protein